MKRWISLFLCMVAVVSLVSCGKQEEKNQQPELAQMRAICELAVMECYYHNVAKYSEENAETILWLWKKDKQFWIEYTGVVTLGIDVAQVDMEVEGEEVTITIPEAQIMSCEVEKDSLSEDSFIVAKGSAKISAEDQVAAFTVAQKDLEETVAEDTVLLNAARQRAQALLEDYVMNIGQATGKEYSIRWVYLENSESDAA